MLAIGSGGCEEELTVADAPCHIINSTRFHVSLLQDSDAIKAPSRLAEFFRRIIQPALDKALSSYSSDDHDYRIDRLVIDLGDIDIYQPDRANSEKIIAITAKALRRLGKSEIFSAAPEVRLRRSFVEFLETGQLPWDTRIPTLASLEKDIQMLEVKEVGLLLEGLKPLLMRPAIRRRLLEQFSFSFLHWILQQMHPALAAVFSAVESRQRLVLSLFEKLDVQFQVAASLHPGSSPKAVAEAIQEQLIESRSGKKGPAAVAGDRIDPEEAEKVVFVSQAGVVLLHPFFIRFFDRRGLLDSGQDFKDAPCREKAVHLLHFLATGHERPEEPQTGIYKILCGLDIMGPVPKNLSLEPEDRDEAVHLLESAIEHWGRLKNTSPDGLRTSFLQRQGKLVRTTEDGWHLTVEQQSIDILLGTLPWNLSVIRFPWLTQPVQVDWA